MARPKSDPVARFLRKVLKMQSGCHEWQSVIHRDGYGKFHFDGGQKQAHRVAYELFIGSPDGAQVLHRCDNRKCVNPDHLFLGTNQDNVKDMDAKKRRGTKCKVTLAQAVEIRRLLADRWTQREVGELFGIDQTTVSRIWLHKIKLFKET